MPLGPRIRRGLGIGSGSDGGQEDESDSTDSGGGPGGSIPGAPSGGEASGGSDSADGGAGTDNDAGAGGGGESGSASADGAPRRRNTLGDVGIPRAPSSGGGSDSSGSSDSSGTGGGESTSSTGGTDQPAMDAPGGGGSTADTPTAPSDDSSTASNSRTSSSVDTGDVDTSPATGGNTPSLDAPGGGGSTADTPTAPSDDSSTASNSGTSSSVDTGDEVNDVRSQQQQNVTSTPTEESSTADATAGGDTSSAVGGGPGGSIPGAPADAGGGSDADSGGTDASTAGSGQPAMDAPGGRGDGVGYPSGLAMGLGGSAQGDADSVADGVTFGEEAGAGLSEEQASTILDRVAARNDALVDTGPSDATGRVSIDDIGLRRNSNGELQVVVHGGPTVSQRVASLFGEGNPSYENAVENQREQAQQQVEERVGSLTGDGNPSYENAVENQQQEAQRQVEDRVDSLVNNDTDAGRRAQQQLRSEYESGEEFGESVGLAEDIERFIDEKTDEIAAGFRRYGDELEQQQSRRASRRYQAPVSASLSSEEITRAAGDFTEAGADVAAELVKAPSAAIEAAELFGEASRTTIESAVSPDGQADQFAGDLQQRGEQVATAQLLSIKKDPQSFAAKAALGAALEAGVGTATRVSRLSDLASDAPSASRRFSAVSKERIADEFTGSDRGQGSLLPRSGSGSDGDGLLDELSDELSRFERGTRIREATKRAEEKFLSDQQEAAQRQEVPDESQTVSGQDPDQIYDPPEQEYRTVSRNVDTTRSGPTKTQQRAYRSRSSNRRDVGDPLRLSPLESRQFATDDSFNALPDADLRAETDVRGGVGTTPAASVGARLRGALDLDREFPADDSFGTPPEADLRSETDVRLIGDDATEPQLQARRSAEASAAGLGTGVGSTPSLGVGADVSSDVGARSGFDIGADTSAGADATPGLDIGAEPRGNLDMGLDIGSETDLAGETTTDAVSEFESDSSTDPGKLFGPVSETESVAESFIEPPDTDRRRRPDLDLTFGASEGGIRDQDIEGGQERYRYTGPSIL